MTKFVAVCLGVFVWFAAAGAARASEAFGLADQRGDPNKLSFFSFTTPAGKFLIRHDGMGELRTRAGGNRVFYLGLAAKTRIDRMYFLQHEGDLFLFYEAHNASSQSAFLARMDLLKKTPFWTTPITTPGAPVLEGAYVIIEGTEIDKRNGKVLKQLSGL